MILLPFFEIFAPFGSTKKHSSLPLQISLSTPCLINTNNRIEPDRSPKIFEPN